MQSSGGGAPTAGPPPRAPLARSWRSVSISGGTVAQRAALRAILRGLGWTAIRSIRIDGPPNGSRRRGSRFSFAVAAPAAAARRGTLSARGMWEAAMVADSYAACARRGGLPRLGWEDFATLLPDGRLVDGFGGVETRYDARGLRGHLPGRRAITARVRAVAAAARLQVRFLGFVHPSRTLPVIVLVTRDHAHVGQRLDRFLRLFETTPFPDLSYVELDTRCGRPVFARGAGVAADPRWFPPCTFTAGCPVTEGRVGPPLTHPC